MISPSQRRKLPKFHQITWFGAFHFTPQFERLIATIVPEIRYQSG
jgi:hypothetical protein